MSVRWERLAGDTASFAVRVSFLSDPHGGRGVDPDMAASWGGLQLWVDGINVSAHVDGGHTLDATYWYLLPLMEWLSTNWDALLHEQRLPNPDSSDAAGVSRPWLDLADTDGMAFHQLEEDWEWRSRHSLRFARDGGIVPGVFIRRHRGDIEISWHDRPVQGAEDIKHIAPHGRGFLDPQLVASSMYEVLTEATDYLITLRPESPRINQLANQVKSVTDPSTSEVRIAWLAGLGPSRERALLRWTQLKALVVERAGQLAERVFNPTGDGSPLVLAGSPTAALLFSSVSASIHETDVLALTELALHRPATDHDPLAAHTRRAPLSTSVPAWEQGYELAEEARDAFELDDAVVDMDDFLSSHGITVSNIELQDPGIRAVTLAGEGRQAHIGVNLAYPFAQQPEVRRFTLAHELCHVLFDEDHGVAVAIASGPWAPDGLEQRANAFAAMFLMPPQTLRQAESRLGVSLETREGIAEVATALRVSHRALLEHARNVGLIRSEARDRLLSEYAKQGEDPPAS